MQIETRPIQASLDGSQATTLPLGGTLNQPFGIALDTFSNWMYVTNQTGNTIVRAHLNGSSASTLTFNGSVTIASPSGIAIDLYSHKLYFVNGATNSHLIQVDLIGMSATDLDNPGNLLAGGAGIAVDPRLKRCTLRFQATARSCAPI